MFYDFHVDNDFWKKTQKALTRRERKEEGIHGEREEEEEKSERGDVLPGFGEQAYYSTAYQFYF